MQYDCTVFKVADTNYELLICMHFSLIINTISVPFKDLFHVQAYAIPSVTILIHPFLTNELANHYHWVNPLSFWGESVVILFSRIATEM